MLPKPGVSRTKQWRCTWFVSPLIDDHPDMMYERYVCVYRGGARALDPDHSQVTHRNLQLLTRKSEAVLRTFEGFTDVTDPLFSSRNRPEPYQNMWHQFLSAKDLLFRQILPHYLGQKKCRFNRGGTNWVKVLQHLQNGNVSNIGLRGRIAQLHLWRITVSRTWHGPSAAPRQSPSF